MNTDTLKAFSAELKKEGDFGMLADTVIGPLTATGLNPLDAAKQTANYAQGSIAKNIRPKSVRIPLRNKRGTLTGKFTDVTANMSNAPRVSLARIPKAFEDIMKTQNALPSNTEKVVNAIPGGRGITKGFSKMLSGITKVPSSLGQLAL
mgnify:CR=1 FL=1